MAAGEIKEIKKAALTKLQQNLSWAKWAAIRKSCGAPVWKKKILEEIESSCCWAGVKATRKWRLSKLYKPIPVYIQTLNEKGLWRFHGLPYILCPIFGDGRSVWGHHKNNPCYLSHNACIQRLHLFEIGPQELVVQMVLFWKPMKPTERLI